MSFTTFQNEKTPLQTIKIKSSKSRNIEIFPKGLTDGFGPKMAIFPTFIFQAIQARKMSLTIFQNEKTYFWGIKARSLQSRKIDIFTKGLTHGFGPKMAIFPTFIFQEIQARKMSFTTFQNELVVLAFWRNRSSTTASHTCQHHAGITQLHSFGALIRLSTTTDNLLMIE